MSATKVNFVFFHNFGMFVTCCDTYFLEVSAHVIFWWLLVVQDEKLIKKIELQVFRVMILFEIINDYQSTDLLIY